MSFVHHPLARIVLFAFFAGALTAGAALLMEPGCLRRGPAWKVMARHPDRPVVVAHRGASGLAPENTLAAYRRAIEQEATIAETDVFVTQDGQVVALHDPTLERTTTGAGAVAELSYAKISAFDAGSWFNPSFASEHVPLLSAVLALLKGRMVLCIEVKEGERVIERVAQAIDAADQRSEVILFSFVREYVTEARAVMPDVPVLWLAENTEPPAPYPSSVVDEALALDAQGLGLSHKRITPDVVQRAHEVGLPVFVYTVHQPDGVAMMVEMGVDGIITNFPKRTQQLVDALRPIEI